MLFHSRIYMPPPCTRGRNLTEVKPFATTMPRYCLHVCNGDGFTQDEEGRELPDVHAARTRAVRCLRDSTASELTDGILKTASFIGAPTHLISETAVVRYSRRDEHGRARI